MSPFVAYFLTTWLGRKYVPLPEVSRSTYSYKKQQWRLKCKKTRVKN